MNSPSLSPDAIVEALAFLTCGTFGKDVLGRPVSPQIEPAASDLSYSGRP